MPPDRTTWLTEHKVAGLVVARIGRRGRQLLADFANVGTFITDDDGNHPRFEPVAAADSETIAKLHNSVLYALTRHLRGKVTLHASAASLGNGAVVFLAPSGGGKSTMVAALCSNSPACLVADDTTALELPDNDSPAPIHVVRSQEVAWLLSDACSTLGFPSDPVPSKIAVRLPVADTIAAPLNAIVRLVFASDATVPSYSRLRGHEAFAALSSSFIRFLIDDESAQVREFEQLLRIVERCPVFELRRRRDLGELPRSVEAVQNLLYEVAQIGQTS